MARPAQVGVVSDARLTWKSALIVTGAALLVFATIAVIGLQLVSVQRSDTARVALDRDAQLLARSIAQDVAHFNHNAQSFAALPAELADSVSAIQGIGAPDSPPGWFGEDRDVIVVAGFMDWSGNTVSVWGDDSVLPAPDQPIVTAARVEGSVQRSSLDVVDGVEPVVTWVAPMLSGESTGTSETEAHTGPALAYVFVVDMQVALGDELEAASHDRASVELLNASTTETTAADPDLIQIVHPVSGTPWVVRLSRSRDAVFEGMMPIVCYTAVAVLATSAFFGLAYALIVRTRAQRDTERFALDLLTQQVQAEERFLASMSHEMRTPLNSIIGFSNVLAGGMVGPVNDEQRRQLSMIERSGRRLLGLVNDVLDLAKVRSGQEVPEFSAVDVRALVGHVVDVTEALGQDAELEVRAELPAQLPEFVSDGEMVERILLNIMGNAVKFTREGSVVLVVSTVKDAIRFDVSDTGPGIPAEEIHRVSKEFFQVARSEDSAKPQGTGLGLTISARLARLLGGTITVESAVGEGSTFALILPLRPSGIAN